MTSQAAGARPARWLRAASTAHDDGWAAPDLRRRLQLALAGCWLLDAILQYQAFMFSPGFSRMLAGTGPGNPAVIAGPIGWTARITAEHAAAANALFATFQLAIALGIAWRPAVRPALAASVAWSAAVWWLGEGLGGVLNGTASPVNGAPGAVVLYALLAVLLWPSADRRPGRFAAAWSTGTTAARAVWLVLWGSLAVLALLPATRGPGALGSMVTGMARGQPRWLAAAGHLLGGFLTGHGPAVAAVLAVLLALIAVSVYLPAPAARAGVVLAVLTAAFIWLGEGLGGILTGGGTDPGSGLLLALTAVAFWPLTARTAGLPAAAPSAAASAGDPG